LGRREKKEKLGTDSLLERSTTERRPPQAILEIRSDAGSAEKGRDARKKGGEKRGGEEEKSQRELANNVDHKKGKWLRRVVT